MYSAPDKYKKKKKCLFCIDSDGCVMDTMNLKHIQCFGPCLVQEWELSEWEKPILKRWNEMNLYSRTRGINRFKGLAMALREIDDRYCQIEGLSKLENWVLQSSELSESSLKDVIEKEENLDAICLKKALSWSIRVNEKIREITFDEKQPFEAAREALAFANRYGDIAIVSSANREAVIEEWQKYDLLEHVDIIMTQDVGSKRDCIEMLISKGYKKEHVLMVGDAPGDFEAAKVNDVQFFPILVGREKESWMEFKTSAVRKLNEEMYCGSYQKEKEQLFFENLR